MSQQSNIEWTDATWNPVRGCVKVSPGCAHCYAETFAERFRGVSGHPYEQGFDLRLVPEKLTEPLSWKKPRRVFVNSMSDLFQDGVPAEFIAEAMAVMAACPQHTFQVLTKRPARMLELFRDPPSDVKWPLPNVWLGVSVENQHFANERIPLLLQTPAAIRFVSTEPLLESVDFSRIPNPGFAEGQDWHDALKGYSWEVHGSDYYDVCVGEGRRLDWVIIGGESGPGARRFDIAWARSLMQHCRTAGVPVFMKQVGSRPDGWWTNELGPRFNRHALKHSKGGDPSEWPADLRVREFPAWPVVPRGEPR